MAPSRSEIYDGWGKAIRVLDQIEAFGRSNSPNLLTLLDNTIQAYEGDFFQDASNALQAIRSGIAGTISPAIAAAVQRPFLRQLCLTVIGRTDLSNDDEMWDELYKYFVDEGQRVESMNWTFGSPSAGTNIGNGQIIRLNIDPYAFNIETQHIDSKRALCVADYQTGTNRGEEVFQFIGQSAGPDELQRSGSGIQTTIAAASADNSLLFNSSFSQFSGTATAPTAITNWTSSGGDSSSIYTFDGNNYFRAAPSDTTPYSISLAATTTLAQKLSVRGTKLVDNVPYLLAVIWNRVPGAGNGTFRIGMGSGVFTSVTVAAQTGWNVTLAPATAGTGNWYRNFAEDDLDIYLSWTRTSGTFNIDDVLLLPGSAFDGSWYWIIPASASSFIPFRVRDSFTWSDQCTQAGINQKWMTRGFNRYAPHAFGSSITFADAT